MANPKYPLLKQNLNLEVATKWLDEDAKDDFYPDPINFADIRTYPGEYLDRREHRMLQIDTTPFWKESVPKRSLMVREAVYLHPIHRILYLSTLHRFLARLDNKLLPEVYSYRLDEPDDFNKYPFSRRMDRWKQFYNDFRMAALSPTTGAVLITDLASYYDHISCDQLCMRIRNLLGPTIDEADEAVIELLQSLLNMWTNDGYGIPQNVDPSSFFGSLYLHNVDKEMVGRRYKYFRWVDDIRIVTSNRRQALRALHDLQEALRRDRLFVATDKTHIWAPDDPEFEQLLDVEDDKTISEAEEILASGDCPKIESILDRLFERLQFHAGLKGDSRKFRAFLNRILNAGSYSALKQHVRPRLREVVIPWLEKHPDRSDYWTKSLAPDSDRDVERAVQKHLVDNPSLFNWQRFYLWKLALHFESPLKEDLMTKAKEVCGSTISEPVTAQAIVCFGKHGDNDERESLFTRYFNAQKSYIIQRAVLIGIQELPEPQRESFYRRALKINPEHRELVNYLSGRQSPNYGIRRRMERPCLEVPKKVEARILRGVGLVKGKPTRFRLTYGDYDYE